MGLPKRTLIASVAAMVVASATPKTLVVGSEGVTVPSAATQAGPYDTEAFRSSDAVGSAPVTHIGALLHAFIFRTGTNGFLATSGFTASQVYASFTIASTLYVTPLTWDGGASSKACASGGIIASALVSVSTMTGGAVTSLPVGTVVYFNGLRSFTVGGGVSVPGTGITSSPISGRSTCASWIYSSASGSVPVGLSAGGAISVSGGTKAAWFIPSVALIGRFSTPAISVLEFTDSIGQGVGDPGNPEALYGGFMLRGRQAAAFAASQIAGFRLGGRGSSALQYTQAPAFVQQFFPYCTVFVDEMGRNTTGSEATEQAAHTTMWQAAFDAGVANIMKVSLFPSSSSTDNWATTANQTAVTSYSAPRDAWYASQLSAGALVRGKLNCWCDLASVRAATTGTDRWKWAANGTANAYAWDSIHPSTGGHVAGGADYRTTLLSVTP